MNEEFKIKKELVEDLFNYLISVQPKDKEEEEKKLKLQHALSKLSK